MYITKANLDERIQEEKVKDFKHEELAFSNEQAFEWKELVIKDKYYYEFDQKSSSSCVAGGGAISLQSFYKDIFSRKDIYYRRFNYPNEGMAMWDLFNIMLKGVALESQVPSQALGEIDMNTSYKVTDDIIKTRSKYTIKAWVNMESYKHNIDEIAKMVQKTPVVMFWYFSPTQYKKEWLVEKPKVLTKELDVYGPKTLRHQMTVISAGTVNGKKYLLVQDTAGVGTGMGTDKNLRLIDEEFLMARSFACGYAIPNEIQVTPVSKKPSYLFTKKLEVGMTDPDVKALQEILIYEKLIDLPASTNYFGGITLKGVKKLQEKYKKEILTPAGLNLPTGYVGSRTIAWLNKNYSI